MKTPTISIAEARQNLAGLQVPQDALEAKTEVALLLKVVNEVIERIRDAEDFPDDKAQQVVVTRDLVSFIGKMAQILQDKPLSHPLTQQELALKTIIEESSELPKAQKSNDPLNLIPPENDPSIVEITDTDYENALENFDPGKYGMQWSKEVEQRKGKVRDIFALPDNQTLFITTDRQSANNIENLGLVPHKGAVLNRVSNFWKKQAHAWGIPTDLIKGGSDIDANVTIAKTGTALPVEVVVRNYLDGTAFTRYKEGQRKFGSHELSNGLNKGNRLDQIVIDATTKGKKDKALSDAAASIFVGADDWQTVKKYSLKFFEKAQKLAAGKGLGIRDLKLEFARDKDGKIMLIDEALTPDSARIVSYTGDRLDKDRIRKVVRELQKSNPAGKIKLSRKDTTEAAQNYIKFHDILMKDEPFEKEETQPLGQRIADNLLEAGYLQKSQQTK